MNHNLIEIEHDSIFQTYKRLPIIIDHADGCRIYDDNGNCYLDFLAGIAVNALGYGHKRVIEAIDKQIHRYMHVSNYFYQDTQILLAEKITKLTGFDRVFFSNSGTEAIEGIIKLARRWGSKNNKKEIISFSGGFHGRTYGALSMMDKPLYKADMGPYLDNMKILPYNDPNALKAHVNDNTLAIILEFVQGEGGITQANQEFVDAIFELKSKYGLLVIADEIQTGVGRTGDFFAFERYSVKPDIVSMAKGIGGGLPLGAILATEALANVWDKGTHGTTYGGNAVACAAGMAVIEELENGLLDNIKTNGEYLYNCLLKIKDKYPKYINEIRGRGFMQGVVLSFEAAILMNEMLKLKIITNATSVNVLRLVPPLIITKTEIDEFITGLDDCLNIIKI